MDSDHSGILPQRTLVTMQTRMVGMTVPFDGEKRQPRSNDKIGNQKTNSGNRIEGNRLKSNGIEWKQNGDLSGIKRGIERGKD